MTAASATREDRRIVGRSHRVGYAALTVINKLGDVVRVPGVGVVVNDAALIRQTLVDQEHFSKVGPGGSSELWTPLIGVNGLVNMDGPEHAHLRRKLGPMFNARFLGSLVDDVLTPHMARLRERLVSGHPLDIAADVEDAAAAVICRLTGYETATRQEAVEQLRRARKVLSYANLTTRTFSEQHLRIMRRTLAELTDVARLAYRNNISGTVPATLRAAGLSEEDTVSVLYALVIAGTETIVSFVPRFTQLVLESGVIHNLVAEPDAVTDAISEAFRVTVPSPVMIRAVIAETTVGGVRVRPGDRMVLSTVMACGRAGDFNPGTPVPKEMRQLWFGAGAHFCIGMPLAILEAEMFARTIVSAYAERPFAITSRSYKTKTIVAGYKELVLC